ncbi:hypothetical protein MBLNU230_g3565t1 [Neophaeotheca triangularis]
MPPTPPRSPNTTTIQDLLATHFPGTITALKPLPNSLYRTHIITTSEGTYYLLRTIPAPTTRLLRHEQNRLEAEATLLTHLHSHNHHSNNHNHAHAQNNPLPKSLSYSPRHPYPHSLSGPYLHHHHNKNNNNNNNNKPPTLPLPPSLTNTHPNPFGFLLPVLKTHGSATWSTAFTGMLESLLADGEDALVNLPYTGIRSVVRASPVRSALDAACAGGAELFLLEGGGGDGDGGWGDFSTPVLGDPGLSEAAVIVAVEGGLECGGGGGGRGGDATTTLRRLCYSLYHSLLAIVRQTYRPQAEDRELKSRKVLTTSLRELQSILSRVGATNGG